METFLSLMGFIVTHWWWISIFLMGILYTLKMYAKKTKWVWDDKVVTFIIGLIRMSKGKEPLSNNKKEEIEKDITEKKVNIDREYKKSIKDRGEELENENLIY
jgi:hypothetical protein